MKRLLNDWRFVAALAALFALLVAYRSGYVGGVDEVLSSGTPLPIRPAAQQGDRSLEEWELRPDAPRRSEMGDLVNPEGMAQDVTLSPFTGGAKAGQVKKPPPPSEKKVAVGQPEIKITPASAKLTYTGMMAHGGKARAVVNGKVVKEGDTVEGYRIVSIRENSLVVSGVFGRERVPYGANSEETKEIQNKGVPIPPPAVGF